MSRDKTYATTVDTPLHWALPLSVCASPTHNSFSHFMCVPGPVAPISPLCTLVLRFGTVWGSKGQYDTGMYCMTRKNAFVIVHG